MSDLFAVHPLVYYSTEFDNLLIYTPGSFFMFGFIEGSTGRKLIVGGIDNDESLVLMGDL